MKSTKVLYLYICEGRFFIAGLIKLSSHLYFFFPTRPDGFAVYYSFIIRLTHISYDEYSIFLRQK